VIFSTVLEWANVVLIELLLFCGFWFLIGAIDDLCVDLIWFGRAIYRRLRYYRRAKRMTVDQLAVPEKPGLLAVFIPTWQEAEVIEKMLRQCLLAWQNSPDFLIYVGCYPNDYAGQRAIGKMASGDPRIMRVVCESPGPTTKADCLNHLWRQMVLDELHGGYKIRAIVMHDAEDMVHRDELRLYNALIERNAVIQIPVIPIRVTGSSWISGHYCDEFAESHGKSMVVREALGVPLPLAGVGCAIERNMLGVIALQANQRPFDAASLTEDYELGLKIGRLGGKAIMARIYSNAGDLVGTRACFPATLETSVRQKSRWLTGIALAGWDRIGWQGGAAQFWMLCRDRKAIFAALVLVMGYFAVLLALVLASLDYAGIRRQNPLPPLAHALVLANGIFLFWRLAMRALFVWRLYGAAEALISVPRIIVSNTIAILAARRAVFGYLRHCFGAQLKWDKTAHTHFPTEHHIDRD
jgi:bacteriophage N4 adsorption protein B